MIGSIEVDGSSFSPRRRVSVWFGECLITSYDLEPELAERYAQFIGRHFVGLRVSIEPLASQHAAYGGAELPPAPLWPLTVQ